MTERPIPFSAPMVRAILGGTKTQTRRVVKPQPPVGTEWMTAYHHPDDDKRPYWWAGAGGQLLDFSVPCRYGKPGDQLWVRETFAKIPGQTCPWIETDYRATYVHGDRLGDTLGIKKRWTPSIHMPRAASRITLEVTGVRVERLQDISEADAMAEGAEPIPDPCDHARRSCADIACAGPRPYRSGYRALWEQINGPGSWASNPWVWVITFNRIDRSSP